jgi:hypothetical protein
MLLFNLDLPATRQFRDRLSDPLVQTLNAYLIFHPPGPPAFKPLPAEPSTMRHVI